MEKQTIYGWPVAIDLFLGGMGAGAFLACFVLYILKIGQSFAAIIFIAGPCLVLLGAIFLMADIAIRRRFYRVFSNFRSWTSRGAWILTFFIVFGLAYAAICLNYLPSANLLNTISFSIIIGATAAFFSLLVLTYPGFLMGTIAAIPLWNTPLLPILFLLSGLSNGIAFLILVTPLFQNIPHISTDLLHIFGNSLIVILFVQLVVLQAFLSKASHGNIASLESLRIIESSQFKWKVVVLGIIAPLGIFIVGIFIIETFSFVTLLCLAAILSLAGGLYLRYTIIRAGVFLPRFSI